MPRVQAVVLPILRAAPGLDGVEISTWVPDIDYRTFPLINIRRVGGARHGEHPNLLDKSVIEMTCYATTGLPDTETLYSEALEALYEAVRKQTQTDAGYLHSIKETMGATQFSSLFMDSWRVQGLIALGVRPPRST
jgi:hypothetical protein